VDIQARLRDLLRQAPGELAKRLGVPVVHAAQAGEFSGLVPGAEGLTYESRFLGEAQIVDGHGKVLARLTYEDGEGIVTADITPGRVEGDLAPIPDDFWTGEIPAKTLERWDSFNELGRSYYASTFRPLLAANSHPA
jgi:hypothetical protein